MDVRAVGPQGLADVDVISPSVTEVTQGELQRRIQDPERALRAAAAGKLKRYGPAVLAFAVDDAGRLGSGAARLLRDLAKRLAPDSPMEEFVKLRSELQHVVLQATASMAQSAAGAPRTG